MRMAAVKLAATDHWQHVSGDSGKEDTDVSSLVSGNKADSVTKPRKAEATWPQTKTMKALQAREVRLWCLLGLVKVRVSYCDF